VDKFRLVAFSFVVGTTCFLACRDTTSSAGGKGIPSRELAEIKGQAFQWATARYVPADTYIELHYKPPSHEPCADAGQGGKRGPQPNPLVDAFDKAECEEARKERRVEAVSGVRGVQLTPLSRNKCGIKFDFVESANPHAKLPSSNEAVAERYETPTGHYWVIR